MSIHCIERELWLSFLNEHSLQCQSLYTLNFSSVYVSEMIQLTPLYQFLLEYVFLWFISVVLSLKLCHLTR